jgi:predicted MPP superfamily phosphohydrolase
MRNPELYDPVQIENTLQPANAAKRKARRRGHSTLILADERHLEAAALGAEADTFVEDSTQEQSVATVTHTSYADAQPLSRRDLDDTPCLEEDELATDDPSFDTFDEAAVNDATTEDMQTQKRGPGFVGRAALALAPLFTRFYDLQMQLGGGVRTVRQRVAMSSYPRNVPPLKIAFLSDLHYGPTTGRVALRQAWQIARDANPDVLLLGGDYLYADEGGLPSFLRELQRWKNTPPPGGMYAVLGNHDHHANIDSIITGLEACNVRVLVNNALPLPKPWTDVWIAGTDDTHEGDPQPELALAGVPQGACSIMLSHSPDVCENGVLKRCGLTLCGHTHGGQICSPSGDAMYMPSKWGKHYPWGLHRHAGNWVFVSRGVGTVGVPARMWAPPDVGILDVTGTIRSSVVV